MGFLPVFVVLLSAILLWTMIGYSSLSRYKNQALEAALEAQLLQGELVADVDGMEELTDKLKLDLLEKLESDMLQGKSLKDLKADLQSLADAQKSFDDEEMKGIESMLLKSIAQKALRINELRRINKAAVRSHNQLIKEKPTSFLANIFGFKAIQVMA